MGKTAAGSWVGAGPEQRMEMRMEQTPAYVVYLWDPSGNAHDQTRFYSLAEAVETAEVWEGEYGKEGWRVDVWHQPVEGDMTRVWPEAKEQGGGRPKEGRMPAARDQQREGGLKTAAVPTVTIEMWRGLVDSVDIPGKGVYLQITDVQADEEGGVTEYGDKDGQDVRVVIQGGEAVVTAKPVGVRVEVREADEHKGTVYSEKDAIAKDATDEAGHPRRNDG